MSHDGCPGFGSTVVTVAFSVPSRSTPPGDAVALLCHCGTRGARGVCSALSLQVPHTSRPLTRTDTGAPAEGRRGPVAPGLLVQLISAGVLRTALSPRSWGRKSPLTSPAAAILSLPSAQDPAGVPALPGDGVSRVYLSFSPSSLSLDLVGGCSVHPVSGLQPLQCGLPDSLRALDLNAPHQPGRVLLPISQWL